MAFPSLAGVHSELARLPNDPRADIRHLDQPGVVCLEKDRTVLDLDPGDVDVHDVAAHLLRVELDFEESIILEQPEEEKVWSDPGPNIGPLVGRGSECMGTCAAARARRLIHIVCPPLTSLPVISCQKWESFDLCFNTNPPAGIP